MAGPGRLGALAALFLLALLADIGSFAPTARSGGISVQRTSDQPPRAAGGFDFYVLALSWSPSYCAAEGGLSDARQCGARRPYAFIVHGLWPQSEHGSRENCPTSEGAVPGDMLQSLYDLMPSAGLIRHEWAKHGSCTGLRQKDYFAVLRMARQRIAVPDRFQRLSSPLSLAPAEVEAAFRSSNPSLPPDAISISCDRRYLRDVRICLTKELAFRSCAELDRRACRAVSVTMPPVR